MKRDSGTPVSVDEYISGFPEDIQTVLQELRRVIKSAAPAAEEVISYRMPAYRLNGVVVYFAAFKDHISLFPTASGIAAFSNKLKDYDCSRGTIRFAADSELPWGLISEIVSFRVEECLGKAAKQKRR